MHHFRKEHSHNQTIVINCSDLIILTFEGYGLVCRVLRKNCCDESVDVTYLEVKSLDIESNGCHDNCSRVLVFVTTLIFITCVVTRWLVLRFACESKHRSGCDCSKINK